MSALAHMIESRGIATTVVGLVRLHMEKTKPPRGLWVPFPLGRPFGEPQDTILQRRVLMAALGLLERRDGPVLLADFKDDAPSTTDTPAWDSQIVLPQRPVGLPNDKAGWVALLGAELAAVAPHWQAAQHRFKRTSVGVSRLPDGKWVDYATAFLSGEIPQSPVEGLSSAVVVRYVADDLKAMYMEAVQAIGLQPSMSQVNRWFWYETVAADFLRALREAAIGSKHEGFKTAGSRFIVPAPFVAKPAV